jgi:hypothetical protein
MFNNIPISISLRGICSEKPDEYNPDDSLDEKIRILKREGRNYSIDTFETLMDVVNRRNIISLNLSEVDYSHIEHLRKIIDKNIENNKTNKFQTLLHGLLNTYELALEKQTDEMKNMKNFLSRQNATLKKEIINFIIANTKLRKNNKEKVKDLILNIGKFFITKDTILKGEDPGPAACCVGNATACSSKTDSDPFSPMGRKFSLYLGIVGNPRKRGEHGGENGASTGASPLHLWM